MGHLRTEQNGVFEVDCGANITDTIAEAKARSAAERREIAFKFNGVVVYVAGDSDADLIFRDWDRGMKGYTKEQVGPYPRILTAADLENDARVEADNERKRQARRAEYDAKERAQRAKLVAALKECPSCMSLKDAAAWDEAVQKNNDPYGGRVIRYADEWARLMEGEITLRKRTVAECANEMSALADDDGITGFQYGCAVGILSRVWSHGEELRRWHNLKTQIGGEGEKANENGGVLNPALLVIG